MEERLRELMEKSGLLEILKSMDKGRAVDVMNRVFEAFKAEMGGRCKL